MFRTWPGFYQVFPSGTAASRAVGIALHFHLCVVSRSSPASSTSSSTKNGADTGSAIFAAAVSNWISRISGYSVQARFSAWSVGSILQGSLMAGNAKGWESPA